MDAGEGRMVEGEVDDNLVKDGPDELGPCSCVSKSEGVGINALVHV